MVCLENKLLIGAAILCFSGLAFLVEDSRGAFGSKIKDIHSFKYQGKPAVIQRVDNLVGYRYHILLNGKDKVYNGNLITDEGKTITVGKDSYKIK